MAEAPDRNLALELVRVTEAAAMAAGRWVGRGDKNGADGAAVNAMRQLDLLGDHERCRRHRRGREGRRADALQRRVGRDREGPLCDVAVDPVDGTTLCAKGMANAVAVIAVAERGTMFDPSAVFYMEKLATGSAAADVVDIKAPAGVNVRAVAKAKGENPEDVTVCILDRPRHYDIVREIRETGARIKFISDGDVAGAIMAAREGTGVDLLLGIGGTPEGIITACAMKCLGGVIQARLWPRRRRAAQGARRRARPRPGAAHRGPGHRRQRLLRRHRHHRRRAAPRGALPRRWRRDALVCVMRSRSGTIRLIESEHHLDKLRHYAAVDFEHNNELTPPEAS